MIGLPKWPALIVTGKPVTPRQAAEIIFRTDSYFPYSHGGTNDREFGLSISRLFGLPDSADWYQDTTLRPALGVLSLNYLHNSRIASCWCGGPHGWCSWDGTIQASTYNIGKYPSVKEVVSDLETIASAFPFLDMTVQLCNHESGYQEPGEGPVVEFRVVGGTVTMRPLDPATDRYLVVPTYPDCINIWEDGAEQGLPFPDLERKIREVYGPDLTKYYKEEA